MYHIQCKNKLNSFRRTKKEHFLGMYTLPFIMQTNEYHIHSVLICFLQLIFTSANALKWTYRKEKTFNSQWTFSWRHNNYRTGLSLNGWNISENSNGNDGLYGGMDLVGTWSNLRASHDLITRPNKFIFWWTFWLAVFILNELFSQFS